MGKKVSKAQDIGNIGIDILDKKCYELNFEYRNQPIKDVGIDGQIELRLNGEYNSKYEVQVKSTQKFKIIGGLLKVTQISRDDLEYWCNDINLPVFIFAIETNTEKVFWVDVREYYKQIRKNKKQKKITVYANPDNHFCIENKIKFIEFTKALDVWKANENLKKASVIDRVRILTKEYGYKVSETKNSLTVEMTEDAKNNPIFAELLINNDVEKNKVNRYIKMSLLGEELFKFKLDELDLNEYKDKNINIYFKTKSKEIVIKSYLFLDSKDIYLKSIEGQLINYALKFGNDNETHTLSMGFDLVNCIDVKEMVYLIDFMEEEKDGLECIFEVDNIKSEDIYLGKMDTKKAISPFLVQYVRLINKIMKKYKLEDFSDNFKYHLSIGIKTDDLKGNIPIFEAIVNGEYSIKGESYFEFNFKDKDKIKFENQLNRVIKKQFEFGKFELYGVILPIVLIFTGEGILKKKNDKYIFVGENLKVHTEDL